MAAAVATDPPRPGTLAPPIVPSRARVGAIDGLRGLFLVLMLNSHLTLQGGFLLRKLHPNSYSFIDAAYGFVLVSGLMVALAYGRTMQRDGFAAGAGRILGRTREIYLWAIAVFAALAVLAGAAPGFAHACRDWLGPLTEPDGRVLLGGLLLLQEATWADILPPYVFYMLAAPVALWACLKGRAGWVLAVSAMLWAATQAGLTAPVVALVDSLLRGLRPDLAPPEEFNLGAWQLLFFAGLALGALRLTGALEPERLFRADRPLPFAACIAVLAVLAGLAAALNHYGPDAGGLMTWLDRLSLKPRAGVLALVNLAAAAYAIGWLLAAAPSSPHPWLKRAGGLLHTALNLPFLRLLGRHSLQVYVWHVVLIYAVRALDARAGPFPELGRDAVFLACMLLLAVPGLWRERWAPMLARTRLSPAAG